MIHESTMQDIEIQSEKIKALQTEIIEFKANNSGGYFALRQDRMLICYRTDE